MTDNDIKIPQRIIKSKNNLGQIYIIRNRVNDKVYIGETTIGYKARFAQHCKRSTRIKRHYKLYEAMNTLGVEKFYVELIEDNVPVNKMYEKEIFYIKKYDSYHNGYNSTKGGDGREINTKSDIAFILESYKAGKNAKQLAKQFGVTSATILRTLQRYNISPRLGDNKYSMIDVDLFKKMWNDGVVIPDMAKYFSVNEKTVRRYVARFKLPLRGKGFQEKAKHLY